MRSQLYKRITFVTNEMNHIQLQKLVSVYSSRQGIQLAVSVNDDSVPQKESELFSMDLTAEEARALITALEDSIRHEVLEQEQE